MAVTAAIGLEKPGKRCHPSRAMRRLNPLLPGLLAGLLAGCASTKVPDQYDAKKANSRAVEQRRMQVVEAVNSGAWAPASQRGQEVLAPKPKEFDLGSLRLGSARTFKGKGADTHEFHYVNKTQTRGFVSKEYSTKGAWMGDAKFATKDAPTKSSWFARRSAATKSYATRGARDATKEASTRALPGGDRAFLVQGRRQAELDANGRQTIPMGTTTMGPSWSGELKPLTIEDVKGLLNKN
jgi:hypothetical protein